MVFFKIRATGLPTWQGDRGGVLRRFSNETQRTILNEWSYAVQRLCAHEHLDPCYCGSGHIRYGVDREDEEPSCRLSHWWTKWRPVNASTFFAPVPCSHEFFGHHPWTTDPNLVRRHRRICQCRPDVDKFVGTFCLSGEGPSCK